MKKHVFEKSKISENIRGKITENAPLGRESWFGCGGSADLLFEPADFDDLAAFVKDYPKTEPLLVLGGMANTIIRDGGVRGCVIRLGKPFSQIEVDGYTIRAGAGALNGSVAAAAAKVGIAGLEFLSGIPGTVGGALRMNAGAYGREIKDILRVCEALDIGRGKRTFTAAEMGFGYRSCALPQDLIFTQALFEGAPEDEPGGVRHRLRAIKELRRDTQPITEKTGGSTFANPSAEALRKAGLPENLRAWQVVERVGGRGLTIGGAQMSRKHCNFMINTGDATAADLENLGEELRRRVYAEFGTDILHWEIKRVGCYNKGDNL
ncbi:MAG: UDP-N-acetylmuramate dehydrogenase [Alphaproteobacteria bacterium]|nr:UDP-N-acetylmuramate dehydrogenase [Alphaproteobacteria bacterium]